MVSVLNRRELSDGGVSSEAIVWFDVVMLGLFDNVEIVTRDGNEVDGDGVAVSIILLDGVGDGDNELVADDDDVISEDSDVKDEDAGVIVVIIVLIGEGVVVES